jgi:DNA-binding NtrC family response regulator
MFITIDIHNFHFIKKVKIFVLKPLVFVIDKEKALSKLFCNWLNDWNYETLEFSTVHESIPHWEKQPNAIIVDLKTINSEKKFLVDIYNKFQTPIILIAHYADYDVIENNNFYDICPFPVEPKHLRQIIKNATNYHKLFLENHILQSSNNTGDSKVAYITRETELTNLAKRARMRSNEDCYMVAGEKAVGKTTFIKSILLSKENTIDYTLYNICSINMKELKNKICEELKLNGNKIKGRNIIELRIPYVDNNEHEIYKVEAIGIKRENIFIIPPLRKRPNDLLYFISSYMDQYNKYRKTQIKGISSETEKKLLGYNWPGNFEELKITLDKAFLLAHSGLVQPDHVILPSTQKSEVYELETNKELVINGIIPWELIKKKIILAAYEKSEGNIFMAAQKLKIGRATMYRLLHKYKII